MFLLPLHFAHFQANIGGARIVHIEKKWQTELNTMKAAHNKHVQNAGRLITKLLVRDTM